MRLVVWPSSVAIVVVHHHHQAIIRNEFAASTLITVAHRLHTIADFDRILVMDAGRAAECDAPIALLSNPSGSFATMVRALGTDAAASIFEKAHPGAPMIVSLTDDGALSGSNPPAMGAGDCYSFEAAYQCAGFGF